MKPTLILCFFVLAAGPVAFAIQAPSAPTSDVATHDELVEKLRNSPDPTVTLQPAPATDPSKIWKPDDLLARSDFFCLAGQATLVPKGAILHVPAAYADRLKIVDGVKIVVWSDFLAANRGWIQTLEVSRRQAEGDEPFPEDTVKALDKSPYVVVATLKGGPISVLPPKNPPPAVPGQPKPPGQPLAPGQAAPVVPRPVVAPTAAGVVPAPSK